MKSCCFVCNCISLTAQQGHLLTPESTLQPTLYEAERSSESVR
jgi:hypothetical protein